MPPQVHAHVSPATGRVTYRGKVLNRTARVADKAGSGQVWCTQPVWEKCRAGGEHVVMDHGIDGTPLRPVQLKVRHACRVAGCVLTGLQQWALAVGFTSTVQDGTVHSSTVQSCTAAFF